MFKKIISVVVVVCLICLLSVSVFAQDMRSIDTEVIQPVVSVYIMPVSCLISGVENKITLEFDSNIPIRVEYELMLSYPDNDKRFSLPLRAVGSVSGIDHYSRNNEFSSSLNIGKEKTSLDQYFIMPNIESDRVVITVIYKIIGLPVTGESGKG
jgi:hypothetical protein